MGELSSVPQIVNVWNECKPTIKFDLIREQMATILGITEYNKDTFYEKFRRDPPRSVHYQLDELLALVRAFRTLARSCVSAYHAIRLFDLAKMTLDDFQHLKVLFDDSEFDAEWRAYLQTHNLLPTVIRAQSSVHLESSDDKFVVGRAEEVTDFERFLQPDHSAWVYEIYGPGGIGKSVVALKFQTYARKHAVPLAFINGNVTDLTPNRMLALIAEGFARTETLADFFSKFQLEYDRYAAIQSLLSDAGGINHIFDVLGQLKHPDYFRETAAKLPNQSEKTELEKLLSNRFGLERYLLGAEKHLIHQLAQGVGAAGEMSDKPLTLLIDTYEEIEGLDDWFCRELLPKLRQHLRIAILGRNALTRVNFEWKELGTALVQKPLPELTEADTKAYLRHFGLSDAAALNQIYQYTQGYPLLLVLVRDLAREVGGWEQVGALENKGDRREIAADLLERLLREERVQEVRAFLEKGVVVDWFNPEIVSVVLDISFDEGRVIYDKLRRHSFVERHPEGLKFHDVIRDILRARLSEGEYAAIRDRVRAYFYQQSGRDDG